MSKSLKHEGAFRSSETDALLNGSRKDSKVIARTPQKKHASIRLPSWFTISLLVSAIVATIGFYVSFGHLGSNELSNLHPLDYAARTQRLLSKYGIFDGHNDLVYLIRVELKNQLHDTDKFPLGQGLLSHTDIPRLRKGRMAGQFWSLYIPCPDKTDFNEPDDTVRDTVEQIDTAHRLFKQYPDVFKYCDNSACARKAARRGQIASMLGAEGLHQVGNSIAVIRKFFDLGMRYITLTHNCDNVMATAWNTVAAGKPDMGLTPFGREVVLEMNRLGMLVDLSHVSHRTMRDVLEITRSPIIFSHTLAYTLAPFFRNAPDDVLRATAQNGGVVMITFVERFITPEGRKTNVADVADHVMHMVEVMGSWDYVGIGGDFDGTPALPEGLEDVSGYPNLIEELFRRGATEEDLAKFTQLNILRVWEANEKIARQLQKKSLPSEAYWSDRIWRQNYYGLPYMFSHSARTRIPSGKGPQSRQGRKEEV